MSSNTLNIGSPTRNIGSPEHGPSRSSHGRRAASAHQEKVKRPSADVLGSNSPGFAGGSFSLRPERRFNPYDSPDALAFLQADSPHHESATSSTSGSAARRPVRVNRSYEKLLDSVDKGSTSPKLSPKAATRSRSSGKQAAVADAIARIPSGQRISQIQETKDFLKKEIEAHSEKLWSARKRSQSPDHEAPETRGRLIIVTAKLPFVVTYAEEAGEFEVVKDDCEANIADLLRAAPVKRARPSPWPRPAEVVLVGAPVVRRKVDNSVVHDVEALWEELEEFIRRELRVVPVLLPANRDSFAERVLFPLLHYQPPSLEHGMGSYDWEGYELVSEKFRDAVLGEYNRGDLVWINDYSLMLLPMLLRKERPEITIGFYMNCVFPSSEVYRILPQREDIIRGVLSANIIGFHTFHYVRHFLTSCTRVLGLECSTMGIEACEEAGGTFTKVVSVPLGINLAPYKEIVRSQETKLQLQNLEQTFGSKKIIVAVDKLEEKKGIPHKMMAYHKFLQKEPVWAKQCIFVQIIQLDSWELLEETNSNDPDDQRPGEKQQLLQQVYQMVGEVNSKFGTIGHLPVHFLCQEFGRNELAALFAKAHVMMDTPLRDMISISAHEFLCCQESKAWQLQQECGVLILSEFSGSAQSLRASALCVNPWDTNAFADAIQEALEMDYQDRVELYRYGHKYVNEYTLQHWALNFLDELQQVDHDIETERLQIPPQLDHDMPVAALRKANRRIVIFGFNGTLLPRKARINAKILPKLPQVLLGNLQVIAEDPHTDLVIMSGLSRGHLAQIFAAVPCWIIAEGGVCYREPRSDTWVITTEQRDNSEWMGPVTEIMQYFAARTPGSTVIQTGSTVQWFYQKTQGDHAAIQSKDLLIHLWAGPLLSAPAEVVVGSDSVTVRPTGIGKATELEKVLQLITCEEGSDKPKPEWLNGDSFVICVSDLLMRDEDVFTMVHRFFDKHDSDSLRISPLQNPQEQRPAFDGRHFDGRGHLHDNAWTLDFRGQDREATSEEQNYLEVNSKSLGELFSQMNSRRDADAEEGVFGLHRSGHGVSELPSMLKKIPSEGALHAEWETNVGPENWHHSMDDRTSDAEHGSAEVFTCAVSRKATRAAYYLSDTHDVAFLVAQFARELRHTKQVLDSPS